MKLICPGIVSAVTCSPDGKYCVAACTEKIYVWQVLSTLSPTNCVSLIDDGVKISISMEK